MIIEHNSTNYMKQKLLERYGVTCFLQMFLVIRMLFVSVMWHCSD